LYRADIDIWYTVLTIGWIRSPKIAALISLANQSSIWISGKERAKTTVNITSYSKRNRINIFILIRSCAVIWRIRISLKISRYWRILIAMNDSIVRLCKCIPISPLSPFWMSEGEEDCEKQDEFEHAKWEEIIINSPSIHQLISQISIFQSRGYLEHQRYFLLFIKLQCYKFQHSQIIFMRINLKSIKMFSLAGPYYLMPFWIKIYQN
jgi:hypothetical protein